MTSILLLLALPPKFLFHAGRSTVIERNIAHRTVPIEDWNKFVMGGSGNYGLGVHRKGLYGTETYGDATMWGERVMRVVLKDECLGPEHVETARAGSLTVSLIENEALARWLEARVPRDLIEKCSSGGHWIHGENYGAFDPAIADCQAVLRSYLDENQKWVVKDDFAEGSWYVRNHSCIEAIEGIRGMYVDHSTLGTHHLAELRAACDQRSSCAVAPVEASGTVFYTCDGRTETLISTLEAGPAPIRLQCP